MALIGFLINPVAGMGGRVGLKGTDDVVDEAIRRGAEPIAQQRASDALREVRRLSEKTSLKATFQWLTCSGPMGENALHAAGLSDIRVVYQASQKTAPADTNKAVRLLLDAGAELILFCGGDGTARDICKVTGVDTPILGIPSGVKMYSGVFGITPAKTAEILVAFLAERISLAEVDILDLDEERYRRGEWAVRLYHTARTPYEPNYTQTAKALIDQRSDEQVKAEIAEHLCELIDAHSGVLFLLGAGSTVKSVGDRLGMHTTLLGIDGVVDGKIVGTDLNEKEILTLLKRYPSCRLVLSPIGAQGFVLGRGNSQLSPSVIKKIGRGNIVVIATPAKLARTPMLLFDTGRPELDSELAGDGYMPVVTGYHRRRMVKTLGRD